jgi:thioredoxin-dependent peroxiredoxin
VCLGLLGYKNYICYMKNFGIKFIISCVFSIAGICFLFMKMPLPAAIAFVFAFFLNAKEIKEYGSFFQFINFRVHTLLLGYSVDILAEEGTYWFTLAMFMMSFAGCLRLEFFSTLKIKQNIWIEMLGIISMYGLYFYANFQHPADWEGWALPILPMLLMTFIGKSIIKDGFAKTYQPAQTEKNTELGKKAPLFSLPNVEGDSVSLQDFENKNHVLLIFVRGDWCPTCHIMIRAYEKESERFASKNIIPIGISPDSTEVNKAMMERMGWKNMLLIDSKQEVASKYGVLFTNNNPETKYEVGVPLPASFLIDKNGVMRYMTRSDRAGELLNPSLIFPIIDNLS